MYKTMCNISQIRSHTANSPSYLLLKEMVQVQSVLKYPRVCFISNDSEPVTTTVLPGASPGARISSLFIPERLYLCLVSKPASFVISCYESVMASLCDEKHEHDCIIGYDESHWQ